MNIHKGKRKSKEKTQLYLLDASLDMHGQEILLFSPSPASALLVLLPIRRLIVVYQRLYQLHLIWCGCTWPVHVFPWLWYLPTLVNINMYILKAILVGVLGMDVNCNHKIVFCVLYMQLIHRFRVKHNVWTCHNSAYANEESICHHVKTWSVTEI